MYNITDNKVIHVTLAAVLGIFTLPVLDVSAQTKTRIQTGVLQCQGDGGWGFIIGSKKEFNCRFVTASGKPVGRYTAIVRKFGLDIGKTGKTALRWAVLGPATKIGANYVPGSLAGGYVGVGAEATAGAGVGANALVGGGSDSFALQPVSVQAQTGVSIAAGVQSLTLKYIGPAK